MQKFTVVSMNSYCTILYLHLLWSIIPQLTKTSLVLQIVAMYAFNKTKYADDPDCDIDFETMRLA